MWLVNRTNPKGKGKKKKAEETYKNQRMAEWIKEQEFLRNQEIFNQGWNNWNNQWVYPVRPSVRRTYVHNGVYLTNFPYEHKYPKMDKIKHKNLPKKIHEPSVCKEPNRPVLYVKKNKVVTEYRPPINLHVNSATVDDATQVDNLPLLEDSERKTLKKDEPRGNIFSVFNWFNKAKTEPHIKLGTDIISALKEKHQKIPPLETKLKIKTPNEMRKIAKMKVKEKKKELDKNTIKKFNKLQEQTFTFKDSQNNGVYRANRKSALKNKSQPNRTRKLSWDKSIQEKEHQDVKEIFKAEEDLRVSSNRLVNIGKVYVGNPLINESSPEPSHFETSDEENYTETHSQSIANVSSIEIGHFEPKFDRDRYLENLGTKIISDTVSEIFDRAVRKKETEKSLKPKSKKVIKLEAERIDDKILIKRRVRSYKDGKPKDTDVLYYMDADKSLDLPKQVDPTEKEQEEKLLYFLRKWANGDVNVVFVKKEDLSSGNLEYDDDDTLIVVNDKKNRMIRVKSVVLGKENLDYTIKDPKWIHIMNDIISYRRGHLMGKRIESTPYRKEILNY